MKSLILLAVTLAVASAVPLLVTDEEGQLYYLTPVVSRQRRGAADWSAQGQGGANSHSGGGGVSIQNPNGSGAKVGYGHANGWGHDLSVDGRVPVWSNKNKHGETTLNVGGGISGHTGYGGTHSTDKRFGASINHSF
ncbi:transcription elongation factor SPT5-like [Sitophilus oryzae]|uniref:Transcription elongation factor SPT5-like n=1 Tax=Sitophilus oryzae TaxID=7048 RepID=A0A6J2XE94_SITOR|nr:transcription elongation factor SPT5-like [Sitophilus oryzae]